MLPSESTAADFSVISINGKKIAVLAVNDVELAQWHTVLGRTGVCLNIERSERPDLFENINCDQITVALDNTVDLARSLTNRARKFSGNL